MKNWDDFWMGASGFVVVLGFVVWMLLREFV